jgi:hypothetical protein
VKDLVVGGAEEPGDPHSGLVAGDRGGQKVFARGPSLLRGGEHRREDNGTWVKQGSAVHVVLLDDVGGAAVHQRSEEGRGALAGGKNLAGTVRRAHHLREPL